MDDVAGRLDAIQLELGDPLDVLKDARELARHALGLLFVEREPRKLGDPFDLLAIDHAPESSALDFRREC